MQRLWQRTLLLRTQKKNKQPLTFESDSIATAADIAALRATTDSRISEIKNTGNLTIPNGATVYYVANNGSDSNNGTSASTPFQTITKVNAVLESSNSAHVYVCFKRGDTWRGEQLVAIPNLTITAYGTGAKPVIMGSPENGGGSANASKWTDMGNNIWCYKGSDAWSDVGNIIFNDGESYGKKVIQLYVNGRLTDFTNGPAQTHTFDSWDDLKNDLDFYHDKDFNGGSGATGYLYLYSATNPAERFESIEFARKTNLVYIHHTDNVTVDNICFKYEGGHAIAADGQPGSSLVLDDLTVQNCEFYWIGGSIQNRIANSVISNKENTTVWDTRYGNAIEVYGTCDGFIARNNYIYQVFDAGITVQKTVGNSLEDWSQKNISFTDNVIENCNYSIEYFLTDMEQSDVSKMVNFTISDNIMWNAGKGFCETRGIWDRGFSAHIKSQWTAPCNKAENFVISGNTMIGVRDQFLQIRTSFGTDSMPTLTDNVFYGRYDFDGTATNGYRLGEVRVTSDDNQIWVSYDFQNEQYLTDNVKTATGNKFYFVFN